MNTKSKTQQANDYDEVELVSQTIRKHLYKVMSEIGNHHLLAKATLHALFEFMVDVRDSDLFYRLMEEQIEFAKNDLGYDVPKKSKRSKRYAGFAQNR